MLAPSSAPGARAPRLGLPDLGLGVGLRSVHFDHILAELEHAFAIHQAAGTALGGVHFELTGEEVTECLGGARGLDEAGLAKDYRSQVDPRLNYEQALEMAMHVARRVSEVNGR